jgi:hypothetical protein
MADRLDNSADFNDDQGTRIAGKTGAGAEAAEGIHGAPKQRDERRDPGDQTSLEGRETGDENDQRGSEPLDHSTENWSSYGGAGGSPKHPKDGSGDSR